jgi:hypothetical protein
MRLLAAIAPPPLGLAQRQARRLAGLHGASPQAIAGAISLWPLGARLALSALDVIDFDLGEDAAENGGHLSREEIEAAASRGEPVDFGMTDFGIRVIADCAKWMAEADESPGEGAAGEDWPESWANSEELENFSPDRAGTPAR